MPKFIVWYKKEFEAKNIKSAVIKEKQVKSCFHSLEQIKEPEVEQKTSAIGFQFFADDD